MRVSKKLCEDGEWNIYVDGNVMGGTRTYDMLSFSDGEDLVETIFHPYSDNPFHVNSQFLSVSNRLEGRELSEVIKENVEIIRRKLRQYYHKEYNKLFGAVNALESWDKWGKI